jgi:hypothetical protein
MSTGGNLVVADATSPTPVSHTYTWDGVDPSGISLWEDRSAGVPIGYWTLNLSVQKPRRPSRSTAKSQQAAVGSYRVRFVIKQPYLENVTNATVSGIAPAPTISYTNVCDGTFVIPERSSLLSRQHIAKMVPILLQMDAFKLAITDLDQPR